MRKSLGLIGLAATLLVASGVLAIGVLFTVALTAGKSIAAGERAALVGGSLDLLIAGAAVAVFAWRSRSLALGWRILATLVFAAVELGVVCGVFLLNLIILNR